MDTDEITEIDLDILEKLWRRHKVGRNYTPSEEAMSAVAGEDRGRAKHRLDELIKAKLLLEHAKDDLCVSINPRRKETVKDLLTARMPRAAVEYLDQAPADDGPGHAGDTTKNSG